MKLELPLWEREETANHDTEWLQIHSTHSFQVCSAFASVTPNDPPKPLQYEILILTDGQMTYNYSLLIRNGSTIYGSRMGSFDSGDGEYIPAFYDITNAYATRSKDNYTAYVQQLKDKMKETGFTIMSYSYPQDKSFTCDIADYKYVQLVVVLQYFFSTELFLAPEHTRQRLETTIFDPLRELVSTWPQYNSSSWKDYSFQNHVGNSNRFYDYARLGIKIYPLRHIHNMTNLPIVTPWNEIYCLQLVNKMRRQMITPFFPQYYGNIRIPNSNVHIFQNKTMYDRFAENSKAMDNLDSLRKRLELEQDELVIEAIRSSQAQIEAFGVLSGECVAIYMEHVAGWPLPMRLMGLLTKQDELEYQGIFFCILHCMWQLGLNYILHTDLHLGNVIIESIPLFDNGFGFHHFCMPKPPPTVSGGVEYDATSQTAYSVKIGDAEPRLPTFPHGEYGIRFPILGTGARVIDFSKAAILDPEAYGGFQPYKASLLEQRDHNIYLMYVNALKFLDITGLTQFQLSAALEDRPIAAFAALEGLDTMMFMGHVIMLMGIRRASPEFDEACSKNYNIMLKLVQSIVGDLADNARLRLQMLADNRFDLLENMQSVYVEVIHKHTKLIHDGPQEINSISIERAIGRIKAAKLDVKQQWANSWGGGLHGGIAPPNPPC